MNQQKILTEDYKAACQGVTQTVLYYSIFQQLVICLIRAPEPRGVKTETVGERERRGQCGHSLNENCLKAYQLREFEIVSQKFLSGTRGDSTPGSHWKT